MAGQPWRLEGNVWIIRESIAIFGAERALFASNFPVDRLCGSFDTIFSASSGWWRSYPPRANASCSTTPPSTSNRPLADAPSLSVPAA